MNSMISDRQARPTWATTSDNDDCGGTRTANPAATTHWGEGSTWHADPDAAFETALVRCDNHDDPDASVPTRVFIEARGLELTVDQVEELGRWLIERAAGYRQAIAGESVITFRDRGGNVLFTTAEDPFTDEDRAFIASLAPAEQAAIAADATQAMIDKIAEIAAR